MNTKGQSLVTFVIMMPLILILIIIITEVGNFSLTLSKCELEAKSALKYALKNKDEDNLTQKINALLDKNTKCENEINDKEDKIEIKITYNKIILKNKIEYEKIFEGNKIDGKIIRK